MLTRIVRMTFEPENIPSFERIFRAASGRIRAFPGCSQLELYRDLKDPDTFFWALEKVMEIVTVQDVLTLMF